MLIEVKKPLRRRIGSLGMVKFDKGYYCYVGSALNNLEKRILRHLRKRKKLRWHIDYLLSCRDVVVKRILYKENKKREECEIAKKIRKISKPIPNFGCSDCSCESHLFKLQHLIDVDGMKIWKK